MSNPDYHKPPTQVVNPPVASMAPFARELFRAVFLRAWRQGGVAPRGPRPTPSETSLELTPPSSICDEDGDEFESDEEDIGLPDYQSISTGASEKSPEIASEKPPEKCEKNDCMAVTELRWCHRCDIVVCTKCWTLQAAHSPERQGHQVHPETSLSDREVVRLLQSIRPTDDERDDLHQKNYETKWFGVTTGDEFTLNTTSRFSEICVSNGIGRDQYPALVSFVGETGAGKSSLITSLVKIKNRRTHQSHELPIPGSLADAITPTSSDVHLFVDPSTCHPDSKRPILYADCEGFGGGNTHPIAAKVISNEGKTGHNSRFTRSKMAWPKPVEHSRAWMVRNFYPMILYTFSDVICYVTKNIRTHEDIITTLIEWSGEVFEASINQALLPYAIIVINICEEGVDEKAFMKFLDREIPPGSKLSILQDEWHAKGNFVETIRELVLCYYCEIEVACIPSTAGVPINITGQFDKLRSTILKATKATSDGRKAAGTLMGGENQDFYFRRAFDHFSVNYGKEKIPFNFLKVENQFESGSGAGVTHIIKAATQLMGDNIYTTGIELFTELESLLASAIALDARRKDLVLDLGVILKEYHKLCHVAKTNFFASYWPCNFQDKKGRRCVNVASSHSKGHQLSNGRVVKAGKHDSSGTDYDFMNMFRKFIKMSEGKDNSRSSVARNHRKILADDRYRHMWSRCHTTCLCCLFSVPAHVLPCGHVLCDACVDDFSNNSDNWFSEINGNAVIRTMSQCPLCPPTSKPAVWTLPKVPRQAAPRILSLDGGGIRAIMQLKILAAMEKAVEEFIGVRMPIQEFFDLIVGTSAGGIVALGLTEGGMSVDTCTDMFFRFAHEAFKKRALMDLPGFKYLVEALHHSRFKSTGLNSSLKKAFGKKSMFGECKTNDRERIKVAVTMVASPPLLEPMVVGNYNRNAGTGTVDDNRKTYGFLRAENKDGELAVWEAARATAAAPRYFKPFHHKSSGRVFLDGALLHNNPIWVATAEGALLWPDNPHPDLVFSIGTGCQSQNKQPNRELGELVKASTFGMYVKRLKNIIDQQAEMNMDSQKAWDEYMGRSPSGDTTLLDQRFARLNVEVSQDLPRLEQVEKMGYLVTEAETYCKENSERIHRLSARLVGSLFYLQLDTMDPVEGPQRHFLCKGTIRCRLKRHTGALNSLCSRFGTFRTVFWLDTGNGPDPLLQVGDVELLDDDGTFAFRTEFTVPMSGQKVQVLMSTSNACWPPHTLISGFPYSVEQMKTILLSTPKSVAPTVVMTSPSETLTVAVPLEEEPAVEIPPVVIQTKQSTGITVPSEPLGMRDVIEKVTQLTTDADSDTNGSDEDID